MGPVLQALLPWLQLERVPLPEARLSWDPSLGTVSSLGLPDGRRWERPRAGDAPTQRDAGPRGLWGDMVHYTLTAVTAEEAISLHMTIFRCL